MPHRHRMRSLAHPHAGSVVIEEFNSCLLQDARHLAQRIGARAYRPVESFHSSDGSERDFCFSRQVALRPPKQRPCRANMPAR